MQFNLDKFELPAPREGRYLRDRLKSKLKDNKMEDKKHECLDGCCCAMLPEEQEKLEKKQGLISFKSSSYGKKKIDKVRKKNSAARKARKKNR